MKIVAFNILISLFSVTLFLSCSSNGEDSPVVINIPELDEECCNAEQTFLAYTFLNNGYVKEIVSLRDTIEEKYAVSVYSTNGKLRITCITVCNHTH